MYLSSLLTVGFVTRVPFSTDVHAGERSLPSMLAGGDLDGDLQVAFRIRI